MTDFTAKGFKKKDKKTITFSITKDLLKSIKPTVDDEFDGNFSQFVRSAIKQKMKFR